MAIYFCCDKCQGTFDPQFTYCPVCDGQKIDELETLREQLAEATSMLNAALDVADAHVVTIKELEQQLAERDAEIERLRKERGLEHDTANAHMFEAADLRAQLASAQAEILRLREALEYAEINRDDRHDYDREREDLCCAVFSGGKCNCHVERIAEVLRKALSTQPNPTQPDHTALAEYVSRAGEVMRERCAREDDPFDNLKNAIATDIAEAIRALPGVTLEDLKGGAA